MPAPHVLLLAGLAAGSLVFCLLAMEAARRFRAIPKPRFGATPAISILKPLAGIDEGLEENLRSFFEQDYPNFEILMAAATESDAAIPIARKLQAEFPLVSSRVVLSGEPPYPNRKVRSVHRLTELAQHDLMVMSDSDIRVGPDFLRHIAAEFDDPRLVLTTCPYRAVPGNSIWSGLEAVMMNTEFLSGILTAWMLEGMKFAVGPTLACRRRAVQVIGGFESLKHFLAEDFVFGQRVSRAGLGVSLSTYVVEHRIGSATFRQNNRHRLRWVRSTRRSRPLGYIGQLFTYPIPLALLLTAVAPSWWPMLAAAVVLRLLHALQTAVGILGDRAIARYLLVVPFQDLFSFGYWVAGFLGNTIFWRGRTYYLLPDGTFRYVRSALIR